MAMGVLVLSILMLLADVTPAADLSGSVVGTNDALLVGATVYVYSASPKKGAATMNGADYPDCQKSAHTDAAGAFSIGGGDSSLQYRLLVIADGHRPKMLTKVDPTKGKIVANLTANPADLDLAKVIKGHVVDGTGAPVAGARIEPFGCKDGQNRWWGSTTEVSEKETYSDEKGQFMLLLKKEGIEVDVKATAPHLAPQLFPL